MKYNYRYKIFAEALYDSLVEDAFYSTMEQSITEGNSKEAMLRYLDYSIVESEQFGELGISNNHEYGISVWTKTLSESLEIEKNKRKKEFLRNKMGEASLNTYNSIVDFMSKQASLVVPENSWYLSIVGILPQHQRKGLGVELINKVLKKTDEMEIPTYLETFNPRNESFYQRIGYKRVENIYEPTVGAKYSIMLRKAFK